MPWPLRLHVRSSGSGWWCHRTVSSESWLLRVSRSLFGDDPPRLPAVTTGRLSSVRDADAILGVWHEDGRLRYLPSLVGLLLFGTGIVAAFEIDGVLAALLMAGSATPITVSFRSWCAVSADFVYIAGPIWTRVVPVEAVTRIGWTMWGAALFTDPDLPGFAIDGLAKPRWKKLLRSWTASDDGVELICQVARAKGQHIESTASSIAMMERRERVAVQSAAAHQDQCPVGLFCRWGDRECCRRKLTREDCR